MSNPSKRKGDAFERDVAEFFRSCGYTAARMPMSGALGGDLSGDVRTALTTRDFVIQCKRERNGWKRLYDWFEDHDMLALRADRKETIYCFTESSLREVIKRDTSVD
jgi:Holliday junction resolvase